MNVLEEKVLELIGESTTSPDVFTDDDEGMAPIRDSLSDAIAEILTVTGGYKRQYYLPLRSEMQFYRFRLQNGNLGWITDVWSSTQKQRLEQTDLIRLTAYNPRWMIPSANPEAYFPVGMDTIGFYPKPSGDSDVMEITIVEIPTAYATSADRIKLREAFKYSAVHYAVGEYWASRGDANEASKHLKLYLDSIGLAKDYAQLKDGTRFETRKEPWSRATA